MSATKKIAALAFAAILGSVLTISLSPAYAQKHGGGGGGHDSGHSASEAGHTDSHDSHEGGKGKGKGKGGQAMGRGGGSESQSLRGIFHSLTSGTSSTHSEATSDEHGGKKGGSAATSRGKKGSVSAGKKGGKSTTAAAEEEDSDRPAWAGVSGRDGKPGRGNVASGTKRGDLFGDMYVLLRDENGVPIMIQLADGTWVVQPVDAAGNPLPLDAEGGLINPELAIAVELGRLNVARSPSSVLSQQYAEVIKNINLADAVTVDASGRLLLTKDGVESAIDSPLANLALYVELMKTGTITGVTDPSKFATSVSYLVDGTKTTSDMLSAASFLAAASDKAGTLTIDKVVDMNLILSVPGTLSDASGGTKTYVDYATFSYDRQSVYGSTTITVLVKQSDGSFLPTPVNVYDAVFGGTNYTSTSGVDGFAQAADDARAVIEYVHDNSVPGS
jgi:hypothetical protein